ncbi:MAG: WD40 repeat domain-containing protein [Candidatus Poribacteria bacterium]
MTDFTDEEALRLSDGLGRADDMASKLMQRVLHWTGGHPYLTQRLSQTVARDVSVTDEHGVDDLCAELFFSERAQEQDSNLQFVRNQMLVREEVDPAALLTVYRDVRAGKSVPHDETNPVINVLQLSGVAHAVAAHMRVRNRIYEHVFDAGWVSDNMPDAEVRRQRTAVRRGMLRAGGIAAAVLIVVAMLAAQAIRQSSRAKAEAIRANEVTARAQFEQGVAMLDAGNELGLLRLVEGIEHAPEGSELHASGQRLWAGWHEPYANRVDLVVDVNSPSSVAFSADGNVLAVSSATGGIHLFHAVTGNPVGRVLAPDANMNALHFSRDGRLLAAGDQDGWVHIWDAYTWETVGAVSHGASVLAVALSGDGTRVASGSFDATVKVWETTNLGLVGTPFRVDMFEPRSVSLTKDGRLIAAASGPFVYVWEPDTGIELYRKRYPGPGAQAAITADGSALISSSVGYPVEWAGPLESGTWGQSERTIATETLDFSMHPDGRHIYIVGKGKIGAVWDTETGAIVGLPYSSDGFGISAFDPVRRRVAAASLAEDRVLVWRTPISEPSRRRLPISPTPAWSARVAFSPDGATPAVGRSDSTVLLFDSRSLQPYAALRQLPTLGDMAFSPDGTRIATTSSTPGPLRLWDVRSGRPIWASRTIIDGTSSVDFSHDGSVLATGSNESIRLWNPTTGVQIGDSIDGMANAVMFSPAELVLAVSSLDHVILWDIETRTQRGQLPIDAGARALRSQFTSDGRYIAVSGFTDSVRVWDMETMERVGGPLSTPSAAVGLSFSPETARC